MSFSAIITAGGLGKRMGSDIPKQFISLLGKPVLMRTIQAFYDFEPTSQILLTLPPDWKSFWEELVDEHHFKIPHIIIDGGKERYHSIKGALSVCSEDIIAVHDGVRPLIDLETIGRCISAAKQVGQAIPVVQVRDSLREKSSKGSRSVDRSKFYLVQTPQCFSREVLAAAYQHPYHSGITDDASLVEEDGNEIFLVEGSFENIKITNPIDIIIAEGILRHRMNLNGK